MRFVIKLKYAVIKIIKATEKIEIAKAPREIWKTFLFFTRYCLEKKKYIGTVAPLGYLGAVPDPIIAAYIETP